MNPFTQLQRISQAARRRLDLIRATERAGQRSVLGQLHDMASLRTSGTRLTSYEYQAMRLYDRQLHPQTDNAQYGGGWFKEWIHAQLNNIRWEAMVTDKAMMYALFDSLGLPHPKVCAIANRDGRRYGEAPVLSNREELANYLRHQASYPLFCKPIKGSKATGSHRIESYRSEDDSLLFDCGSRASVTQFVTSLEDPTGFGVLLQRALTAAPETRELCGQTIAGCRIVMLLHDGGAKPFRAIWKIPTEGNFTDNFCGGRSGNLIASIEPHSGRATRVVRGAGLAMHRCSQHPDTGAELEGFELPGWKDLIETVTRAAEHFPGFRWQHWDVGLSAEGPMLFELNSAGAVDLIQMADGRGIYDDELKDFVRQYGQSARRGGQLFPDRSKAPVTPLPAQDPLDGLPRIQEY